MDRLVDELWGERPPDTATKTVQVYVSRLRKELGRGSRAHARRRLRARARTRQLDAERFERLAGDGRDALERGEAASASELLRQALDVWRGPPLADLAYEPFAQSHIARLEELRLVDARAAHRGRPRARAPCGTDPRAGDTGARASGARAAARPADPRALPLRPPGGRAGELPRRRRALVDELGIEPSRELQDLERAILTQDPEIDAPARARPGARWPGGPARRSAARRGRRAAAGRRAGGDVHRG